MSWRGARRTARSEIGPQRSQSPAPPTPWSEDDDRLRGWPTQPVSRFAPSTLVDRLCSVERALDCVLDDREIGEQVRAGARRQAFRSAHAFETSVEQGECAAEIPGRLVG